MEPGPAHRRRRPAVACSECRRRKIRCDRGFPCGPCRKSLPALSCIYHSQPRAYAAPAPPRSHIGQHQHQHQRQPRPKVNTQSVDLTPFDLPRFESDTFDGLDHIGIDWQPSWEHQMTPLTGHLTDAGADYFQSPTPTLSVIHDHENKKQHMARQGYPGSSDTINPGSVSHSVAVGPDSGDDRWYQILARIGKLEFLVRDITRHQNSDKAQPVPMLRDLYEAGEPHECPRLPPLSGIVLKLQHQARVQKQLHDKQSLARPSPLREASSKIHQLLPPRQACKKLVSAYFETFGSVLCILDTTVFTSEFERFWEATDASRVPSTDHEEAFAHKLLVVLALGSVTCPSSPEAASAEAQRARQTSRRSHAIMCVQHTRQWLAQKTARGIRADLDLAQILCLLALARQTQLHADPWPRRPSMDGTVILTGDHDLARLGMQMGLHRELRTGSMATPAKEVETELRRRLWATMLELSLHQYLDAELPPPLGSESYDCATPSSNGVEEEHRSLYLMPDAPCVPASTVLAALSRTQRLRLRILEHLHASGASKDLEESQRLAVELNQILNAEVSSILSAASTQPTSFQLWLLSVLIRPFILALGVPLSSEPGNRFADYYFRRLRLENAVSMLRPGPHEDGPRSIQSQIPSHAGQAASKINTAATSYPFLPTPGTAEPCNTSSEEHFGTHKAACASLYMGGPSYYAVVHRQVVASLCVDVVAEIEDDMFPTLDAAMLHRIVTILEDVVNEYRDQVHASGGANASHEFILFAAAHSLALASLTRSNAREVNKSVTSSVWMALHHCCQAMGEPAEAILESGWETEAVEAATEPRHVTASVAADADQAYEIDAQLQGVKYILQQQQGDGERLDVSTADGAMADMWAFDDESYFSVGLPL